MQTRGSVVFQTNVRSVKKYAVSDFDRGMTVGFSISETADLLGFSCTTVSRVCTEWCKKTSSEQQFWRQKRRRRRARLVKADSNENNHILQYYAEEHLWAYNISNHSVDRQQQQKTNTSNKYLIKCSVSVYSCTLVLKDTSTVIVQCF